MFSLYSQLFLGEVKINITGHGSRPQVSDGRLMSPSVTRGGILTSSNTSDWSPTLPKLWKAFYGLFPRWIRERNIKALGSVPCGVLSLKRPVITFLNAFSQRLSKLRFSFVPSTRRVRPAAKRCESLHTNTLLSTLLLICSTIFCQVQTTEYDQRLAGNVHF